MIDTSLSPLSEFKILKPEAAFNQLENRDIGGLYSIALTGFYGALREAGYAPNGGQRECWSGNHFHVYIGESYSLKLRLMDHFFGDERTSNFRKSLTAILGMGRENRDSKISDFLMANALVGILSFSFEFDLEKHLIQHTACPLNIVGKGKSAFAKRLKMLRAIRQAD